MCYAHTLRQICAKNEIRFLQLWTVFHTGLFIELPGQIIKYLFSYNVIQCRFTSCWKLLWLLTSRISQFNCLIGNALDSSCTLCLLWYVTFWMEQNLWSNWQLLNAPNRLLGSQIHHYNWSLYIRNLGLRVYHPQSLACAMLNCGYWGLTSKIKGRYLFLTTIYNHGHYLHYMVHCHQQTHCIWKIS